MNIRKKSVLIFLVLILLITSMLGACSKTTTPADKDDKKVEQTDTSQGKKDAEVPQKSEEKITISYYSYWCGDIVDDNYCETLIQDALNIEIKTKKVNHTQKEQVDLMLASGDMPDCGWFDYDPRYMYYEQELTRLIPVDMIKQYAPSYIETYNKFPILYRHVASKEDENQHYALVGHQAYFAGNQYFFCNYYRKDWLDKFGIEPDTPVEEVYDRIYITEKGFTLDQFEEILRQFTLGDPDGNGQNDTVGMVSASRSAGDSFCWAPLMGAFGFNPSYTIEEDGKAVYYYSTERYKDFLKYVSGLSAKGYIDKEILTLDWQQSWEKAKNGYGGYFVGSANWLASWAMDRPPMVVVKNNPEAKILMTPGQIGYDGSMGSQMYSPTPAHGLFYINKDVTDEAKLAKILEFAEYTGYGENRINLIYGEEGVDFDMVDGKPVRREGFVHGGERGIHSYSLFVQDEEVLDWSTDAVFGSTRKYTIGSGALWNKYLQKPYRYDIDNSTNLAELNSKYESNINTIVNEYFASVLVGELDVDSTWDDYINRLNSAG